MLIPTIDISNTSNIILNSNIIRRLSSFQVNTIATTRDDNKSGSRITLSVTEHLVSTTADNERTIDTSRVTRLRLYFTTIQTLHLEMSRDEELSRIIHFEEVSAVYNSGISEGNKIFVLDTDVTSKTNKVIAYLCK